MKNQEEKKVMFVLWEWLRVENTQNFMDYFDSIKRPGRYFDVVVCRPFVDSENK